VAALWREVDAGKPFSLAGTPHWAKIAQFGFASGASSHADRIATIRRIHQEFGVLVDPHSADGIKVGLEQREAGIPLICLETALPAKFAASIEEAIGCAPPRPKGFERIEDRPRRFSVMDPDVAQIKNFIADRAAPAAGR
jgi:threonine synthase